MSVNSLGYLSNLTTDFTNVRAMGDFAVDGVLTVQDFSANSLTGHLSANTINAESGSTVGFLGAISTNTLAPQSGNTITVSNGVGMVVRSIDSGGLVFNARAFGVVGDGITDDTAPLVSALAAAHAGRGTVGLPGGSFLISSVLTLKDRVRLVGLGRETSRIVAAASFPADTPMVQLGETETLAFGTRLENVSLIGQGFADIGVYSGSIQEQSGLLFVHVNGCKKKCIHIASDSAQAVKAQNYLVRDIEVSLATTATDSSIALHLEGDNNAAKVDVANITVNVVGGASDVSGAGVQLDGITGHVRNIHVEHVHGGGVLIGLSAACQALTLDGVEGHSSVKTLVYVANRQNVDVTITGVKRSGSSAILSDHFTNLDFTDDTLGFYHTGQINSGGVPNYPLLRSTHSSPTLSAGSVNDLPLGVRVGTIRATANASGTTVTGFGGGLHGREIWVYNIAANSLSFAHANAGSLTTNRINMPGGSNVTLGANDVAQFRYDGQSGRWRLVTLLT